MSRKRPALDRIMKSMQMLLSMKGVSGITVSELCEVANVSRSTFYAYYSNVDEVYRDLVRQMLFEATPLKSQLRCGDCPIAGDKAPLCALLRGEGEYKSLTGDERFMQTLVDILRTELRNEPLEVYQEAAGSELAAQAAFVFQIAGCVSASKIMDVCAPEEWESAKSSIDTFIRGGLAALRSDRHK